VLDVQLPDIDGLEIARRLRADSETAGIPILQTSATYTTSDRKIQGLESGADAYLTQPIEPRELIANVRALLRAHAAEKQLRDQARLRAEELSEENRRMDQFLAMLAHELRNPLNAIATANTVQSQLRPDDPQQARLRATIARQTRHLARMVDDLLEVSRLTRGRIQLHTSDIDLRSVVEQAAMVSRPLIDSRSQRLELRITDDALPLHADPLRLEQAVVNVLNNAAKYSEPNTTIEVIVQRVSHSPDAAVVRVIDHGIGVAPEQLKKIFNLFMQVDASLARSLGGLGIGLTISRSLVEMHGGTIEAVSAGLGKGTEVTITLPLALGERRPADDEPRLSFEPSERQLDVLVIEDNADAAELLKTLLDTWGHSVRIEQNGISGMKAAMARVPQVAVIDIGLPGIDGYQVAENLRAGAATRDIYLVAITGYGRPEDRARALEVGFDDFIVKPLNFDALERAMIAAAERAGLAPEQS
jgi:signal transduction histidine kinase